MNLLLEVKSIRRCQGGHTCNLIANGRKVAFIAPEIFEWTNYSKKVDVLTWFSGKKIATLDNVEPVELKEGWESNTPDHKMDEAKHEATEDALLSWIKLHFIAYEIVQRCKATVMTLGTGGAILDWGVPPGKGGSALREVAAKRFDAKLLNGLSVTQIVSLMQAKPRSNKKSLPASKKQ